MPEMGIHAWTSTRCGQAGTWSVNHISHLEVWSYLSCAFMVCFLAYSLFTVMFFYGLYLHSIASLSESMHSNLIKSCPDILKYLSVFYNVFTQVLYECIYSIIVCTVRYFVTLLYYGSLRIVNILFCVYLLSIVKDAWYSNSGFCIFFKSQC